MEVISNSPQETEALGEKLAARLSPGDIIAFSGDLGSGKTAFTRGLAKGLGIEERVTSPTFTIVNDDSPSDPGTPDTPSTPGTPNDPGSPNTPNTPGQPGDPGQPGNPGQPGTPDTPDDVPKTGDTTNLALWIGLLAISGTGLAATLMIGKKKRYRRKRMK